MTPTDGLCVSVPPTTEVSVSQHVSLWRERGNIGVLSDLHVDYNSDIKPSQIVKDCVSKDVSLLIVCGDIHFDLRYCAGFLNSLGKHLQVIFVLGNHELFLASDYNDCVEFLKQSTMENVHILSNECVYLGFHGSVPFVWEGLPESVDGWIRIYGIMAWDGNEDYVQRGCLDVSTIPYKEYESLEVCGIPTICVTHYPIKFEHPDIYMYIHGHDHVNRSYYFDEKLVVAQQQVGRKEPYTDVYVLDKEDVTMVDMT